MKLTMLGTGHAMVTECYNTCFVLRDGPRNFLVDGGGGSGLIRQLKRAGLDASDIGDAFVTHRHLDHLTGMLWLLRAFSHGPRPGESAGTLNLYGHDEVIAILQNAAETIFRGRETETLRERVRFHTVEDGETCEILGRPVTFFDIRSVKAKQFGFTMDLGGGGKLTCCGDEPFRACERPYAENSTWLLHEAFCLEAEAERYHPRAICHSTVKEACEMAEELGAKNLVLYHTEDEHLADRRQLYTKEGRRYFRGNLYVPDDLETIEL